MVFLGTIRTGSVPWLAGLVAVWRPTGEFWGSEFGRLGRGVLVRVVTMAMVGVGIMAMGVVGVAALSIRGRVLVAMTGVTLTEF